MNELSANTTFESRTGKSNIDLTLVTSNVLRRISDWKISDEESNSDHSIINYDIRTAMSHNTKPTVQKFTVNAESMEKYQGNIRRTVEKMIREQSNKNSEDDLDERLYKMYVCLYVCIYVCMCLCTYVRTYVCMYVCVYVRTYVCMYVCRYVRTYACLYVCIFYFIACSITTVILHALLLYYYTTFLYVLYNCICS